MKHSVKRVPTRAGSDNACEEADSSKDTTLALNDWDHWLQTDSVPDN